MSESGPFPNSKLRLSFCLRDERIACVSPAKPQRLHDFRHLIGGLLIVFVSTLGICAQSEASLEDLTRQVRQSESASASDKGTVLRQRTFAIEERSLSGTVLNRAAVVWQRNVQTGSQAYLFYDEGNLLRAGEWRFADGTRKSYWREPPTATLVPAKADAEDPTAATMLNRDNVWLYAPSSELFAALAQMSRQTVVKAVETQYEVDLRLEPAQAQGIIRAKLTVERKDWRIAQATLITEQPESIVEYQFKEAAAIVPAQPAPPSVTEWETALAAVPSRSAPKQPAPSPENVANVAVAPVAAPPAQGETITTRVLVVGSLANQATARTMPTYPVLARRTRARGTVTVHLELDEQGKVAKILKVAGPAQLQEAAANAARSWRFTPTLVAGQPVRVSGYISFNFIPER